MEDICQFSRVLQFTASPDISLEDGTNNSSIPKRQAALISDHPKLYFHLIDCVSYVSTQSRTDNHDWLHHFALLVLLNLAALLKSKYVMELRLS